MKESMGQIKREKMGRKPCCEKQGVNTGTWSAGGDKILKNYIQVHGEGKWRDLPKRAGLNRCGKSCRLRWLNYLRPDIKRGNISADEEELIIRLHKLLGNRWSLIAGRLPGRTDNEIKNYWNTNLSRREKPHSAVIKSTLDPHPPLIRTKAVRCTKVNILPPMHPAPTNTDNSITRATMSWDAMASIPQDNDQDCSAFLLDFDISDLLLPDMTPQYSGDHSLPPPRTHSPHWTTTTHVFFQPNLTHQMNGSSCA